MTSLVFVAVASQSLQINFSRALRAEYEAGGLPEPDLVARNWKGREVGQDGLDCPFSEVAPLLHPNALDPYDEVGIVLVGRDDEQEPLLPRAARRKFDDSRYTLADYVRAYCVAKLPKVISVEFRSIGPYAIRNDSTQKAAIKAAVLEVAADIEAARLPGFDVAVNEVAGSTVAQMPLLEAAESFGWQKWDRTGRVAQRLERRLDESALAHQWGVARSLLSGFEADRLVSGAKDETAVTQVLEAAEAAGVIQFLAPRDSEGTPSLGMNRFGMALFRRKADKGRPFFSASQRLLQSQKDSEARVLGERLRILLEHWSRADLFGANQVSELVTHTESHCEAVDRNVASMSAPLLAAGTLNATDVFHLAVAAWLHDWGHSGAAWSKRPVLAAIRDPRDLRDAHGLLSAERIRELPKQTGLTDDEKWVPAILAGHHQGWSSIELGEHPDSRLPGALAGLDSDLLVLNEELSAAGKDLDPAQKERVQLLIAIFRVCDASDVGIHRAFYYGVLADRVRDEIALYAQGKVRGFGAVGARNPQWDGWLNNLNRDVLDSLEGGLVPGAFTGPTWLPVYTPDARAAQAAIVERARFCLLQPDFFKHHYQVLGVHLATRKRDERSWVVQPHVTPRDEKETNSAVFEVCKDIHRELGDDVILQADGSFKTSPDEGARHKASVKRILEEARIEIALAVSA